MSFETQPLRLTKVLKFFGLACLLIGAAMLLYSGARYAHRFLILDQLTGAQNNIRIVMSDETWERFYADKTRCRELAKNCSSSTHQILMTNRKLYFALAGVSLLLAAAGGVMCVAARERF
ncbi:MAG: hypothetical protein N2689_01050 [Verrucomicrobiae bacterium]|nr:hypothetical protein [Verrucomicrobiae bacterium]